MKNKHIHFIIAIASLFLFSIISCTNPSEIDEDEIAFQEDTRELEQMLMELEEISESILCEDAAEWKHTPIGDKACGGPSGYLAYSINIDTLSFLMKVDTYTKAESDYNFKWGIASDCEIHLEPIGIDCEDGKAKLLYR